MKAVPLATSDAPLTPGTLVVRFNMKSAIDHRYPFRLLALQLIADHDTRLPSLIRSVELDTHTSP